MRVAALFDIHGNLPALEAVLEDLRDVRVDRVVVGGDLLPGPMARETLTLLLNLDVPVEWIYGNGEVAVLERMAGSESAKVPEQYRPAIAWTAEQVRDHEKLIRAWPMTVRLEIDGLGSALFCHEIALPASCGIGWYGSPDTRAKTFSIRRSPPEAQTMSRCWWNHTVRCG